MDRRLVLHNSLLDYCPNVYFQPPSSVTMKYPCIVYELNGVDVRYASNIKYNTTKEWTVTYICKSVKDRTVGDQILNGFDYCSFENEFIKENLYQTVMKLYF